MSLRIDDKWLWDFWFAEDGEDIHIFYLQADKALGDPEKRHWNVSVGHAVSTDMINWTILPDALHPSKQWRGDDEPFDSLTTWTGCVIREAGRWVMFYTGTMRSEKGLKQRIGRAESDDLVTWVKCADMSAFGADPAWYETLEDSEWYDQSWRDPWVFRCDKSHDWHMYLTAREKSGSSDGRGVVGHAVSKDLLHWQALPPVAAPGWYSEMEVPQVFHHKDRYYLIYSVPGRHIAKDHLGEYGLSAKTGTYYMVSDQQTGPYRHLTAESWIGDADHTLYAARVLQRGDDAAYVFAFHNLDQDGNFTGVISDPVAVETDEGAKLVPIPAHAFNK